MAKLKKTSNSMRTLGSTAFGLEEREEDDFYATHPLTVDQFVIRFQKDTSLLNNAIIWECACGQGHMSKVLEEKGFKVYSTDLIDRGYGFSPVNFLGTGFEKPVMPNNINTIMTNPPYSLATDFVKTAIRLVPDNGLVIMYLRVLFLEGKARRLLFEEFPPKYIYVHSERQGCAKGGDFEKYPGSAMCFAWFIWQKGSTSEPILRWL